MGKTTATECVAAMLASRFPTNTTERGENSRRGLADTVLRTRWRHRFTALEIGANLPGALKRAAWAFAPDTVVVLQVAGAHTHHFASIEDIAAEKAQLLSRLGRRGVAILNGDDPRVAAMASRCRCKVLTFGRSPGFDVWADRVSCVWPARLSFRVHWGGESREVTTRLVGEHWLTSVLGAFAAALWHGVDLASAVAAVERVEPALGRMEPMPLPSGAVAIRDEFNNSFSTLSAALAVLAQASGRRILVFCDVQDTGLEFRARFHMVAPLFAKSADLVLLFGDSARRAVNAVAEGGMPREKVRGFRDVWGVAEFLKPELREGDVVLFRSSLPKHAERIYFAQLGTVGCRQSRCARIHSCDSCPQLLPGLELVSSVPKPARPFWEPRAGAGHRVTRESAQRR